jgi:hypothetical protein
MHNIHATLDPQESNFQEAGTDYATFTKLHQIVYYTISEWARQQNANKHGLYQFWLLTWHDHLKTTINISSSQR